MPEFCFYHTNLRCPYVGMFFLVSPCFNCYLYIKPTTENEE